MKKESLERIEAIEKEIHSLNVQINEKYQEIEKIYLQWGHKYKDSYIEYFDGEKKEYVYMKVEREVIREEEMKLELSGPALIMDDTPLIDDEAWDDEYERPDICSGVFDYFYEINVCPNTLAGHTYSTIRKIKKEHFKHVLTFVATNISTKFGC